MSRKSELLDIVRKNGADADAKAEKLIDEIIFIEEQLVELKKLPFINVNPENPMKQKATPASRLYKEAMQQYNNSLRLLFKLCGDLGESEEESPLRKWAKSRKELEVR